MSKIIEFTPRQDLSELENLKNFIRMARDELTIWSELPGFRWDNNFWITTHKNFNLTNLTYKFTGRNSELEEKYLMSPVFREFAKAWLRYSQTLKPTKAIMRIVNALKAMDAALGPDITLNQIVRFNERDYFKALTFIDDKSQRQMICSAMLFILKSMSDFSIITADAYCWKNPYTGIHSYDAERGTQAPPEIKEKKIPDQNALLAVADVFSRFETGSLHDADIMITSLTGIFISVPMRINEVLRLRVDALKTDEDKTGTPQQYLAYWVPKTKEFARKAIPASMGYVSREAIKRLILITEEGRKLAAYMETGPEKFYRHPRCPDVPDDQILSGNEITAALGMSSVKCCNDFLQTYTGSASVKNYTLNSLWKVVLMAHRKLNPHFPFQEPFNIASLMPLKMSESLLCFRSHQLAYNINTSPVLLQPFTQTQYRRRLNPLLKKQSFFIRHGFKDLHLKSHSIRTLLNRIARQSGVSIETITSWSSRASVLQTRTYLHDKPADFAEKGALLFRTTQHHAPKPPVADPDIEIFKEGPFHKSRYGLCVRSWRAGPCNKFADCLNCTDLLMCKGDKFALQSVRQEHENLRSSWASAVKAIENGERSASLWTEKTAFQLERMEQLLMLLMDPDIPDGSPVALAGQNFSHEKVIMDEKKSTYGIESKAQFQITEIYSEELLSCLKLLDDTKNA
ncbi:hypothetical protein ABGT23_20120 [Enterobacter cloacae]|uniref:hypothetical protein n=1 Tax=Enterobacter cloacae TaxID=550 RepID=UPI00345DE221